MSKLFGANFENRLTEKKMSDQRFRDNEKKILEAYYSRDNHVSADKMAKKARLSKSTNDHDKMFMVYTGEITELLCAWGEEGFLLRKADTMLRDIMYLTNSMKSRLDSLRLEEVKDGVISAGGWGDDWR